ncbi:MAG: hypothetical protein JW774_11000 [Candidatus Aureabacteria bacterium]|nr:hypothetical protein [Candidatus Auribacterota bacterium]
MEIEQIIETIRTNLEKNGYPAKRVSFPKMALINFINKHDFELEDVLGEMQLKDIFHEVREDRIIFSSNKETPSEFDFSVLNKMDPAWIRQQAEMMMKHLTPEQLEEVRKKYEAMDPEEKRKVLEMAKNMGLSGTKAT